MHQMQIFEADIFKIFRGHISPDLPARQGPPVLTWCYGFCRFGLCSASSPVARDHWGIFDLIIKESGDEGSNSHHSPLALYARSHHPSLVLLACSRVPQSPLSLGKACGGGRPLLHSTPAILLSQRSNSVYASTL